MSVVNSKSGGSNTKAKLISKVKVKALVKPSASNRFNYLINCKHDLKNAFGCPMCRLVHIVTRKHFDDEREQNRLAHEHSLINRAQLRLTLMLRWARSQSILYNKYVSAPTFDIVLSKALASILVDEDAVMSREQPIDFDEVIKVLERRNRITEVGHFAAIFLQSRIRKYLAKRFVRRMVLQRFEYVPATRRKEAFYIDTYWSRKKERTPRFLRQELPATPRTIGRRLAADERQRNTRYEAFKKDVVRRYQSIEGADVWAQEETTVRFLKQMGVLRDLVRLAMLNIAKMRQQREVAAEKVAQEARLAAVNASAAQSLARRGSVSNRINLQKQAEEAAVAAANAIASNTDNEDVPIEIQPVWICLSAPCMSSRELGLALALATVPSPASGQLAVRKHANYGPRFSPAAAPTTSGGMAEYVPPAPGSAYPGDRSMPSSPSTLGVGKFSKMGTATSILSMGSTMSPSVGSARSQSNSSPPKPARRDSTTSTSVTSTAQLHRALNFLEVSLWQCLRCSTPEEVLSKLLVEDLRPTFVSVMNITQEEKNIWRGKMGHIPSPRAAAKRDERRHSRGGYSDDSSLGSEDRSDNSSESEKDETEEDEFAHEVLPLTLQLRPHYPERGCNGFFRLFFYMDELIVASSVSPWAFYPEVLKNRDLINNSLRAYAALPSTRSFLQQYLTRANIHTTGQDLTSLAPGDLQPVAALSRNLGGLGMAPNMTGKGSTSGKNTPQRRPSVNLNRDSTATARRKSLVPPTASASAAVAERGPELTHLFAPPEELIFHGTAPDRAAYNRMRDISQFSDEKTMQMSRKYTFMNKNTAFAERLKRAEHNAATRLKRRGATTAAPTQTVAPSKAFIENSPFHQRRARLEEWFVSDRHLSSAALYRGGPLGEEVNAALIKDIHSVQGDLLGGKLMRLLLGPEAGDPAEDSVNVFDGSGATGGLPRLMPSVVQSAQSRNASVDTRTSSTASASAAGVQGVVGSSPQERELPEYEAKLHRYSSKARVEIMERLRRPTDVPRIKELFPMVVMDVYVQLPGKAGLGTPGTPGGNFQGSLGSMRRGFSAASGVTAGSALAGEVPNTPTNTLGREATSSTLNTSAPGAGLLAVDLQQIVGAFTCDCDRPPPNLDCGLVSWEHFYRLHQSRVSSMFPASLNSFNEGSSNNSVSSASSKGSNSASSAAQRSNYWTTPSAETGISTYLSNLPSGLQYQFHMLANPPSKPYLERTLPRKVKEWVGLPV